MFDRSPAFMGRYFWAEDRLNEVDHHDRAASAAWNKVTGGNADDGSLLTLFLFLCVAAAAVPKTILTEKSAATLVRKIRKSGFRPGAAPRRLHPFMGRLCGGGAARAAAAERCSSFAQRRPGSAAAGMPCAINIFCLR